MCVHVYAPATTSNGIWMEINRIVYSVNARQSHSNKQFEISLKQLTQRRTVSAKLNLMFM